jgi:hypothetical protein
MMRRTLVIGIIATSHAKGATMPRVDDMYISGPETLIARSTTIVTGPVSGFSKRILETEPRSNTPLRWEISGEVARPVALKGMLPPPPINFVRVEEAVFLMRDNPPPWETNYLLWQPGDHVVIFFDDSRPPKMRVFPSGTGDRDLAGLVGRIAALQSIPEPARRFAGWRDELTAGPTAEDKKAAVRVLLGFNRPWNEIAPLFRQTVATADPNLRGFVFGSVANAITRQRWPDAAGPAEFLCEVLAHETSADTVAQYLGAFAPLLGFAGDEDYRAERRGLRERLRAGLRRCEAGGGEAGAACRALLERTPE